jgi:hypothetical protein
LKFGGVEGSAGFCSKTGQRERSKAEMKALLQRAFIVPFGMITISQLHQFGLERIVSLPEAM